MRSGATLSCLKHSGQEMADAMTPSPDRKPVLLEICVGSVNDAHAAARNGADRLELCAALSVGGLTPSAGLLREVIPSTRLPVICMARPRAGGFCYGDADFRVMRRDIDSALEQGAAGIAFGVLAPDGTVDADRCRGLVRQIAPAQAVFHRAFDLAADPIAAVESLIDLGVTRVLTSGGAATALQGAALIADLIGRSRGRIEVLPAAGVSARTVTELVTRTGCDQVHASCRTLRTDGSPPGPAGLSFGSAGLPGVGPHAYEATDPACVALLAAALRGPR